MSRFVLALAAAAMPLVAVAGLPALPEDVSSAGGAAIGNTVYVYGGHTGAAHTYSTEDQSGAFRRLDLSNSAKWEDLASGPKLQGLALVAHGGKVYRLGGFTALNAEGEDNNLKSQAAVAVFDPKAGTWEDLTPLPEPRSSFEAAVVGNTVYVVGGWNLHDGSHENWHSTVWSADLAKRPLAWESVGEAPFKRRAVAVAARGEKLYVIGGMQQEGGTTRRVEIFNTRDRVWSRGPDLLGEKGIDGFGTAACEAGGEVYVSSLTGAVQKLSADGSAWEAVASLDAPRFFHQMEAVEGGLFVVGGANMTDGKISEPVLIPLSGGE